MPLSKDIRKVVDKFRHENGNDKFTIKELLIYFNTQHDKKIEKLEIKMDGVNEIVGNFSNELTAITTTNRNMKYGVSLFLIAMGIAMSVLGYVVVT